jgi:hypothetical protein
MNRRSNLRRHRALTCAALALIAAAFGLVIGRATVSPGGADNAPSEDPGPTRRRAGVPIDFAHSPGGAAEAVASYQRAFGTPAILRPGVLQKRIEAMAMPDYAKTMLAANRPGQERITAGPIGQGLADGLQTIYLSVPIGYRVESYSPQRARILTWGFTLLGNASAVEPAAYFGLTHTELIWSRGQWRIAETQAGFGPTPKLASAPGPLGGYDVIGVATQLKSYELAP